MREEQLDSCNWKQIIRYIVGYYLLMGIHDADASTLVIIIGMLENI